MTVIETLKYLVTPGETVSLCALKFELTEEDSSDQINYSGQYVCHSCFCSFDGDNYVHATSCK